MLLCEGCSCCGVWCDASQAFVRGAASGFHAMQSVSDTRMCGWRALKPPRGVGPKASRSAADASTSSSSPPRCWAATAGGGSRRLLDERDDLLRHAVRDLPDLLVLRAPARSTGRRVSFTFHWRRRSVLSQAGPGASSARRDEELVEERRGGEDAGDPDREELRAQHAPPHLGRHHLRRGLMNPQTRRQRTASPRISEDTPLRAFLKKSCPRAPWTMKIGKEMAPR